MQFSLPLSGHLLETSCFIRRVEGFAHISDDDLVIGPANRPVLLSETGERIWEALEYATTMDQISAALTARYDIDAETCRREVARFLSMLGGRGLIVEVDAPDPMRDRYLALLKRGLVNLLYVENEQRLWLLSGPDGPPDEVPSQEFVRDIRYLEPATYRLLVDAKRIGEIINKQPGRYAHTMVGLHGLTHIERLTQRLFAEGVAGDFVDAGTCRGGCAIFMRALQHAFREVERQVWVADSFTGVPRSTSEPDLRINLDLSEARYPWLTASLEVVRDNFATYGYLDGGVQFLPGLFADTLADAPVERIALLRIDADLYSSTTECLEALYDRVVPGGFVIVDDYGGLPPCREAVDTFRERRGITAPIERINWTVVHWRKDG